MIPAIMKPLSLIVLLLAGLGVVFAQNCTDFTSCSSCATANCTWCAGSGLCHAPRNPVTTSLQDGAPPQFDIYCGCAITNTSAAQFCPGIESGANRLFVERVLSGGGRDIVGEPLPPVRVWMQTNGADVNISSVLPYVLTGPPLAEALLLVSPTHINDTLLELAPAVLGIGGNYTLAFAEMSTCSSAAVVVQLEQKTSPVIASAIIAFCVLLIGIAVHVLAPRLLSYYGMANVRIPGLPTLDDIKSVLSIDAISLSIVHGDGAAIFIRFARATLLAALAVSFLYTISAALNDNSGAAPGIASFARLTSASVDAATQPRLKEYFFACLALFALVLGLLALWAFWSRRNLVQRLRESSQELTVKEFTVLVRGLPRDNSSVPSVLAALHFVFGSRLRAVHPVFTAPTTSQLMLAAVTGSTTSPTSPYSAVSKSEEGEFLGGAMGSSSKLVSPPPSAPATPTTPLSSDTIALTLPMPVTPTPPLKAPPPLPPGSPPPPPPPPRRTGSGAAAAAAAAQRSSMRVQSMSTAPLRTPPRPPSMRGDLPTPPPSAATPSAAAAPATTALTAGTARASAEYTKRDAVTARGDFCGCMFVSLDQPVLAADFWRALWSSSKGRSSTLIGTNPLSTLPSQRRSMTLQLPPPPTSPPPTPGSPLRVPTVDPAEVQRALETLAKCSVQRAPAPDDVLWENLTVTPPRRAQVVAGRAAYIVLTLVIGSFITALALLLQQMLRTPTILFYVGRFNAPVVAATLPVIPPLLISVVRIVTDMLAIKVVALERLPSRHMREEAIMFLLGLSQFTMLLAGPFLWFFVGQSLVFSIITRVSPVYAERNQDLASYVFSIVVQQGMLVPGLRLMDIFVLLRAATDFIKKRKLRPAYAPAVRYFPYVEQYAIYINTFVLLELGDAPTCAIAFLVFLVNYVADRYSILFVAQRSTTLETHQRLLRYVYRLLWVLSPIYLITSLVLTGILQPTSLPALGGTVALVVVVFAVLCVVLWKRGQLTLVSSHMTSTPSMTLAPMRVLEDLSFAYKPPTVYEEEGETVLS